MKKKLVFTVLLFLTSFILASCGSKPDNMDGETYKLGKNAVSVMEDYLDGNIGSDEADERLSNISDRLDDLENDNELEDLTTSMVALDISTFSLNMSMSDNEGMEDAYNDLKETLGM